MIFPKAPKFKFCPLCKTQMKTRKESGVVREYCPQDGYVHYTNPAPGAAVLITENGKVLLIKRKFEPFKGFWSLPAGFIEWDETPWETARKEAKEETGLDVEILDLFDVRHVANDPRETIIFVIYTARIIDGKLKAGDDAAEAEWWPLNRLPSPTLLEHKRTLEKLKG